MSYASRPCAPLTLVRAALGALAVASPLPAVRPSDAPLPVVEFALAAQSVAENTSAAVVTLTLSEVHGEDVTVPFTLGGSATFPDDYATSPSPAVVPAGAMSVDIDVTLTDDAVHELDETAVFTMGTPVNATPGTLTEHTLTILDDDPAPVVAFRFLRAQAYEGAGTVGVLVTLDAVAGRDAIVPFMHSGSAQLGQDYTIDATPLVIPAGATSGTIGVTLLDDAVDEGWERLQLAFDAGIQGATPGTPASHVLLVIDDDGITSDPGVAGLRPDATLLDFASRRVGEASGVQTVTVTNTQNVPITFESTVVEGDHAADFVAFPGLIPFVLEPGQSSTIDLFFTPLAVGERTARLRVVQTPNGVPETTVLLFGRAFGPTGAELLVNAGPEPYVDLAQQFWAADHGMHGASAHMSWPGEILGTDDDPLYQVVRRGTNFGYSFELPDGAYDVFLHMAELVMTQPGWRVFDVSAEGELAFDDLDLFALAGTRTAWRSPPARVELQDGVLDLDFVASVGQAVVAAIEVRSVPVVAALEPLLDFGAVDPGAEVATTLHLSNTGLHAGQVSALTFAVDAQSTGSGEDFWVEVAGTRYYGAASTVQHALVVPLPAQETTALTVGFEPLAHRDDRITLSFTGDFRELVEVTLAGTGSAGPGWGYLHPVLAYSPALVVDYDTDGFEDVLLEGSGSHTHESGRSIALWEWRQAGQLVGASADLAQTVALGETTFELTITDDGAPPAAASDTLAVAVHPPDAVPGILASYYLDTGQGTLHLLDNVPPAAHFAERIEDLTVAEQGGLVGGSPYAGGVMVRLQARFEVAGFQTLQFVTLGGLDSRVEVNGLPHSQPELLPIGTHALEVRFAVDDLSDLPLVVEVYVSGVLDPGYAAGLTHDATAAVPTIHAMSTNGPAAGGNEVTIRGHGLHPRVALVVHWGGTDVTDGGFLDWSPGEVRFPAPAGTGTIQVTVETAAGVSLPRTYEYAPAGPVPVAWTRLQDVTVADPTTGDWGPDGRLYVGTRGGQIAAVTFDEDYAVTSFDIYAGVSNLTNPEVLGVAFDPFDDPAGPVRMYVGHAELFANGGGSFVGPSPFTGQVSILTGPSFDAPVPLITGLPTSNHDHGINGLVVDANGDLLLCVGANTNAGVRWPTIGDLPESPLSGAILKALLSKPGFNGQIQYELTATGELVQDQVLGNEIDVVDGVDILVHAPGFRNTYDLILATWGELYATDNGPNNTFGPASTGPTSTAGDPTTPDEVMLVERGNYYGHANRSRGRYDPRQNVYRDTTEPSEPGVFTQNLTEVTSSTNGLAEYRATSFGGQLRGYLVAQLWLGLPFLVELSADRRQVVSVTTIENPQLKGLDVITGPGGALLAMRYTLDRVEIMVPDDASAVGLVAHDITPWRAPSGGGQRFVLAGEGFGTLANTSVTIGGAPAALDSVTPRRIVGTVPAHPSGASELLDVEVQVALDSAALPAAFRYLPPARGMALGRWTAAANAPATLDEMACGVVDGTLIAVGASDPDTHAYDLLAGTWGAPRAPRIWPGGGHACEVLDGRLYLFGGLGAAAGRVQIYDVATDTWSAGAGMPWAASGCASGLVDGRVHVAGGVVTGATVTNFGFYDPTTDTWDRGGPLAPLPFGVNHAAGGSDGTRVWVFGGWTGDGTPQPGLDLVQVYDPATDTWDASPLPGSTLAPLPLARGGTGRAVFESGAFHLIGGGSDVAVFDDVQVYDPATNAWRVEAPMPTARRGTWPVHFQSRVFVAGGSSGPGPSALSVLEVFTRQ